MTEEIVNLADMMVVSSLKCKLFVRQQRIPELNEKLTIEFEKRKEELIQAIIKERTPKLKAFLLPKPE